MKRLVMLVVLSGVLVAGCVSNEEYQKLKRQHVEAGQKSADQWIQKMGLMDKAKANCPFEFYENGHFEEVTCDLVIREYLPGFETKTLFGGHQPQKLICGKEDCRMY